MNSLKIVIYFQVLKSGPGEPKYKFSEPNPFVSEDEGEIASVGYRYRKWNLNNGVVSNRFLKYVDDNVS